MSGLRKVRLVIVGSSVLLAAGLAGCGGAASSQPAAAPSKSAPAPTRNAITLAGQPPLQVPEQALTPAVQATLANVRAGLALQYTPPSDTSAETMAGWIPQVFEPWAMGRVHAIAQALGSLNQVAGDHALERAISRWALAWLLDDTASRYLDAPTADIITSDAKLAARYRTVVWQKILSAFVNPAINEYSACASQAEQAHEPALKQRCEAARSRLEALRTKRGPAAPKPSYTIIVGSVPKNIAAAIDAGTLFTGTDGGQPPGDQ